MTGVSIFPLIIIRNIDETKLHDFNFLIKLKYISLPLEIYKEKKGIFLRKLTPRQKNTATIERKLLSKNNPIMGGPQGTIDFSIIFYIN